MADNKPTHEDELKACKICNGSGCIDDYAGNDVGGCGTIECPKCSKCAPDGIVCEERFYGFEPCPKHYTRASTPPAPQEKCEGRNACGGCYPAVCMMNDPLGSLKGEYAPKPTDKCEAPAPQAEGEVGEAVAWVITRLAEGSHEAICKSRYLSDVLTAAQSAERLRIREHDLEILVSKQQIEILKVLSENTQLRLSLSKAEEHGRCTTAKLSDYTASELMAEYMRRDGC